MSTILQDVPTMTSTLVSEGEFEGIQWNVTYAPEFGHMCGYAKLPDDHPWVGKFEDEEDFDVDVHGGITFANGNWIGFDTGHAGDYWEGSWMASVIGFDDGMIVWDQHAVEVEAEQLARQIFNAKNEAAVVVMDFLVVEIDGMMLQKHHWDKEEMDAGGLLKNLQGVVKGWVEPVDLAPGITMWLNEEGMLNGMKPNFMAMAVVRGFFGRLNQPYYGPALFTGGTDEEGLTLPLTKEDAQFIFNEAMSLV